MMMAYLFGVETWMDTAHCVSHFADDTKLEGWIIRCKKGEVSPCPVGKGGLEVQERGQPESPGHTGRAQLKTSLQKKT